MQFRFDCTAITSTATPIGEREIGGITTLLFGLACGTSNSQDQIPRSVICGFELRGMILIIANFRTSSADESSFHKVTTSMSYGVVAVNCYDQPDESYKHV